MKPANYPMEIQIGATFVGQVFLALDENMDPVDLTGCVPYAEVRRTPEESVVLNLTPTLIAPGILPNLVTVTPGSPVLVSAGHGLASGISLTFTTTGILPRPLRSTERYIVPTKNLTTDTFEIISFHAALLGSVHPLTIMSAGSGDITGFKVPGQILVPEISDEVTNGMAEVDGGWQLMIQDPTGRRLAPYVEGKFPIKKGFTDPA